MAVYSPEIFPLQVECHRLLLRHWIKRWGGWWSSYLQMPPWKTNANRDTDDKRTVVLKLALERAWPSKAGDVSVQMLNESGPAIFSFFIQLAATAQCLMSPITAGAGVLTYSFHVPSIALKLEVVSWPKWRGWKSTAVLIYCGKS